MTDSISALLAEAREARLQGRFDEAVTTFETALARDPGNLAARIGRAAALSQGQRLDEAAAAIDGVLADCPDDPDAHFEAGFIARAQRRHEDELRHFDRAAAKAAHPIPALLQLVEAAYLAGRPSLALDAARRATGHGPDVAAAWIAEARAAQVVGDAETRLAALRRAAALDPGNPAPLLELAQAALDAGDGAAALALIEAAAALPSHPPELELLRGHALLALGQEERATDAFRLAVAANPAAFGAAAGLIHCLLHRRDYVAAEQAIAQARERFGLPPDLATQWAAQLHGQGRLVEARDALRGAYEAAPEGRFGHWETWFDFELQIGSDDSRAACLRAARPVTNAEAVAVLRAEAQAAEAVYDWAAARDAFGRVVAVAPDDGIALDALARIEALHLNHEEALGWLRRQADAERRADEQRPRNPSQTTTGQVALEFRLDQAGSDRLRPILSLPPEERIGPLLEAARALPDSTAIALWLLISLRQAGRFERPPPATVDRRAIPSRLLWLPLQDATADAARMESWQALNPGIEVVRMDGRAGLAYLTERHGAEGRTAWLRTPEAEVRMDLLRLTWLAEGGGWSVAPGMQAAAPLARLGAGATGFVAAQERWGAPGNALLGAAIGDPVAAGAAALMLAAISRGDMDHPWLRSGPGLLARAIASTVCRRWGRQPLPCLFREQAVYAVAHRGDSRGLQAAGFPV